jgi:hypothetical protein
MFIDGLGDNISEENMEIVDITVDKVMEII